MGSMPFVKHAERAYGEIFELVWWMKVFLKLTHRLLSFYAHSYYQDLPEVLSVSIVLVVCLVCDSIRVACPTDSTACGAIRTRAHFCIPTCISPASLFRPANAA